MVKKGSKNSHNVKRQNSDLDLDMDTYEPSESDDEYNENEKLMLTNASKRRSKRIDEDEDSEEEEVFGIHDSDDDDDGEAFDPLGDELDSDIEGKAGDGDNLPDSKAWGSRKQSYYNTDYVDQDYGGFSKAEEEEAALLEEEEARAIQTRLIAELEDADFTLGLIPTKTVEKSKSVLEEDDANEVIKTDITKLSKREKFALLEKESPEFMGLISDFKVRMSYLNNNLEPIIALVKSGEIPECSAVKFVRTKYLTILNYCTNIAFYLLLKSKRVRVTNHPVIKRLVQFRKLLEQMDSIDEDVIQPQVTEILNKKKCGKMLVLLEQKVEAVPILSGNRAQRRKQLQKLREEEEGLSNKKPKLETFEDIQHHEELNEDEEVNESEGETEKRGITFEIAKNKGLTPKRKKENRNPRVKHRNKFRKATIRRKGQIRGVYKETARYGGELFGIKASVSKSVKLK